MTASTEHEIKLPDFTGTEETVVGEHIVFVMIEYDDDRESVMEGDGIGEILEFRRHTPQAVLDRGRAALENDPDAVMLSCYEHGGVSWFPAGTGSPPDMQWDGCTRAGVWIPDDAVREAYTPPIHGEDRRAWMVAQARSATDLYNAMINGNVYRYEVEVYAVRKDRGGDPYDRRDDYRREEPLAQDGCGGYIDLDGSLKNDALRSARVCLEEAQGK